MRFVHTADWHLGRRFFGHSLIEEQAFALEQMERLCVDAGANALVVAGDVFDRAVPPVDAVQLLDDFLERMSRRARVPVFMISGNHDSPERLGFGRRMLEHSSIHIRTKLDDDLDPVVLHARGKTTAFHLLPFLEPMPLAASRKSSSHDLIAPPTHDHVVRRVLDKLRTCEVQADRAVLVGHLFCRGAVQSPNSERPLNVGGSGLVGVDALSGFDYVALGHLHRPQLISGNASIRYSGSLLKYSVEEHDQEKGVVLIDLDSGEKQFVSMRPRCDVVLIEDKFDALLESAAYDAHRDNYVAAVYLDRTYVVHAAERLRERFPNLIQALPKRLEPLSEAQNVPNTMSSDDPRELIAAFWDYVHVETELEPAHVETFEGAVAAARIEISRSYDDEGDVSQQFYEASLS